MDARIKELIKRIERLEAAQAAAQDEDFVRQIEAIVAGYEARVEYLRSKRIEHCLG